MATDVAAGTSVASLTAQGTLQFADRYGYMLVTNPSTAAGPIYVSGNPAVTSPAAGTGLLVNPGDSVLVANGNPLWYQSLNVIQNGVNQFGAGASTSTAVHPGMVQSQRALNGQMANPGTTISSSGACTVMAAG